jgi:hypothetical protein
MGRYSLDCLSALLQEHYLTNTPPTLLKHPHQHSSAATSSQALSQQLLNGQQ